MFAGESVSHYRIVEKLGEGGMGAVYLAEDTRLGRLVALKFLPGELTDDERAKDRFAAEAFAASSLQHPSICTIHDIDQTKDGLLFISMAYCEGGSLADRIEAGPLNAAEAVDAALQIADGLVAAHEKGIVHRDIKPANIMLTARGRAKIVDFGLAVLMENADACVMSTYSGTAAYMSPEQAQNLSVDARTDVWSLGATLYEMATGRRPFDSEYREAALYSICNGSFTPPSELAPGLPDSVERIITKCLEKNPDDRYQTADELYDALDAARAELPAIGGRRRHVGRRLSRSARAARVAAVPAAVALALAVVALTHPTTRLAVLRWFNAAPLPGERRVAVLPFKATGDSLEQLMAEGVSVYLTERLSDAESADGIDWVADHRDIREKGVSSPAEAGSVVGASLAITGDLERNDDMTSIRVELWDVSAEARIATAKVTERIGNVSGLQDSLPDRVARLLRLDRRCAPPEGSGTTVPVAFEAYLQGLGRTSRSMGRSEKGLGIAQIDSINIAAAESLLCFAVREDPVYALAWAALARVRAERVLVGDDEAAALECCRRAIELGDLTAAPHVIRAELLARRGESEEAITEFQRALTKDPICNGAIRGLAQVYASRGDVSRAELTYRRALQLRPGLWSAHNDLGILLISIGRYEDAASEFERSSELAPRNAEVFRNLGVAYYCLEQWDASRKMFERSISMRPTYSCYSNLATLYFQLGRYADAARTYTRALEIDDSDYRVWGNLGASYLWVPGERETAREVYAIAAERAEEERRLTPGDATLLSLLAGYYGALGDSSRALPLLTEALALAQEDVDVMFQAGHTYERIGDRKRALLWIGEAVRHGYSVAQVRATPGLRGLCSDERFHDLVERGTVRF